MSEQQGATIRQLHDALAKLLADDPECAGNPVYARLVSENIGDCVWRQLSLDPEEDGHPYIVNVGDAVMN